MKPVVLIVLIGMGLSGCHAGRTDANASGATTSESAADTAGTQKGVEKSRNSMLDKSMNIKDEHWTSMPASASSASAPASPSTTAKPVAASSIDSAPTH